MKTFNYPNLQREQRCGIVTVVALPLLCLSVMNNPAQNKVHEISAFQSSLERERERKHRTDLPGRDSIWLIESTCHYSSYGIDSFSYVNISFTVLIFCLLDYQSRKVASSKRDDFGLVRIVQDVSPVRSERETTLSTIPPVMDTIIQQTYVAPAKLDLHTLDDQPSAQRSTITATEQLVEQTAQTFEDIRKCRACVWSRCFVFCFTLFDRWCVFPAPKRAVSAQVTPPVGERLIKSKIIPEQARALAHALKHAVVKPLKKTMTKKKSFENNHAEQLQQSSSPPLSPPPPLVLEHSAHHPNETSIDSLESTSSIALTPPPAKPPRHGEESGSSSSTEIHSPPVKPPRHFSLHSHDQEEGLIQQTDMAVKKVLNLVDTFGAVSNDDADMTILRQTSPSIYIQQASSSLDLDNQSNAESPSTIETFVVDPVRLPLTSHTPMISKVLYAPADRPLSITTVSAGPSFSPVEPEETSAPTEITELANHLTATLFEDLEKQLKKQDQLMNLNSLIDQDRQKLSSTSSSSSSATFRDNAPLLPQSTITTTPPIVQSTTRPLMFVSLDSGFNIAPVLSPLLDITTTRPSTKVTTSVTIISPPQPEVSSTSTATTVTATSSDDEEPLNSSSTLMPNSSLASDRSKFLQTSSKESSIDSTDTNPYDNVVAQQQNTGSATPARSLISDYDNLHGSYGSLDDETQQPVTAVSTSSSSEILPSVPTTASSSMSTIYETADSFSSSSNRTLTSPTYVSALSTLNNDDTSGSATPSQRLNSDISDEDLVESYEVETPTLTSVNPFRSSKGRLASHTARHARRSFAWHVSFDLPCYSLSSVDLHIGMTMRIASWLSFGFLGCFSEHVDQCQEVACIDLL